MLEIENIKKIYKTGDFTQVALNDVSVKFRKNEFVTILGQSGSGKTTLLSLLSGLEKCTEGNIYFEDESLNKNFPVISMYLRVIYRKCDNNLKEKMNSWIEELQKNNYYNNLFLEDAIIMIMDV